MFKNILDKFLDNLDTKAPSLIVDTTSQYEFNMQAIRVGDVWYVLVNDADWSRAEDIDEIIKDEFNATTEGWCSLGGAEQELVPFAEGDAQLERVTYEVGANSYWLLKISPESDSRLLAITEN
ncbi:MAG TPA: hypothetical protein VJM32_02925 [Candidatus Saccharimonadales bacterium]|nr:hypothetical protein [Candidatus Saccharimonadales bacterium]